MKYYINHSYKEEIILPYIGLDNNVSFFCDREEKEIVCSDGVVCKITEFEHKNIFDFEEDILRIYGMDIASFLKRWHSVSKGLNSMYFMKMKLKKIDI